MKTIENPTRSEPNPDLLQQLAGQVLTDMGAAVNGALTILGDRLGIYEAMAESGPATSQELAERTSLDERYLREWLSCQAASGYVSYDGATNRFHLSPEQTAVFGDPESPAAMAGGFYSVASCYHDEQKISDLFRTGDGIAWGSHHNCLFCGVERFFRPGYKANLVANWLPALNGVVEKLKAGARVADIGCGHGASTIIMAQAFPNSQFVGVDIHEESIETARRHAADEGVRNVHFKTASAEEFADEKFDLATVFDALHDMGDPVAVAKHIRSLLADDGTWMIVEPLAGDTLADNLHPIGRVYYGFSTMVCLPTSKSQETAMALGAQAGEKRLREVVAAGGFSRFRRATDTPVNMILEVRP